MENLNVRKFAYIIQKYAKYIERRIDKIEWEFA